MPDDNQSTTSATPDPSVTGVDQDAEQAANAALEQSANQGQDLGVNIPALSDIEYATPSAYIDPDLPAYDPNATLEEPGEEPEQPEEQPEEETIELTPEQIAEAIKASHVVMAKVAEKIANARNILIALSSDPSVDELASAISLSLFLDRLGKHAIAIYSGTVPNALNFLNPESIFEKSADVLQDFVVAIDKDKADHLRYKLDGDFVKVFITPYRDRITANDLEFSYGDYNVDLVLCLNVNNGLDLDPALREYGTVMHDAIVVNITTGNPGKFGEIEWNNRYSSSVSEMIADLFCNASGDAKLNPEEATALLAGIVASTDRFARANTVSTTMQISSQLIDFGANPQLVADNITDDVDNQFFAFSDLKSKKPEEETEEVVEPSFSFESAEPPKDDVDSADDTTLQIIHSDEEDKISDSENSTENDSPKDLKDSKDSEKSEEPEISKYEDDKANTKDEEDARPKISKTLDYQEPKIPSELSEPSVETQPGSTSNVVEDPSLLDELKATEASLSGVGAETAPMPVNNPVQLNPESLEAAAMSNMPTANPETVVPASNTDLSGVTDKYGQMLTDALGTPAATSGASMESVLPPVNPAASIAPTVNASPEVNGLPDINYGQNSDQVLPPPPAPPVDINSPMPLPNTANPTMPTVAPTPAASNPPAPDAFTIPGVQK